MANGESHANFRTLGILLMYVLVFVACLACEEEDAETFQNDPTVNFFFLNKSDLDQVNVVVDSLDEVLIAYDLTIAELNLQADSLVDSLGVLTDSIAKGGDLKEDSATVRNDLDTLNVYLTGVEKEDSIVGAERSLWADTANTISSGLVKVSKLTNNKNGESIRYSDSSTIWNIPLDMLAEDVDLNFKIEDQEYQMALSYQSKTSTDELGRVIVAASHFEILESTFVNSRVKCARCQDIETTIYVEF